MDNSYLQVQPSNTLPYSTMPHEMDLSIMANGSIPEESSLDNNRFSDWSVMLQISFWLSFLVTSLDASSPSHPGLLSLAIPLYFDM